MWIKRSALQSRVRGLLRTYPVGALLGARQVGKTPLARRLARQLGRAHHFDLEHLFVVHAGEHEFSLGKAVTALSLEKALRRIA